MISQILSSVGGGDKLCNHLFLDLDKRGCQNPYFCQNFSHSQSARIAQNPSPRPLDANTAFSRGQKTRFLQQKKVKSRVLRAFWGNSIDDFCVSAVWKIRKSLGFVKKRLDLVEKTLDFFQTKPCFVLPKSNLTQSARAICTTAFVKIFRIFYEGFTRHVIAPFCQPAIPDASSCGQRRSACFHAQTPASDTTARHRDSPGRPIAPHIDVLAPQPDGT